MAPLEDLRASTAHRQALLRTSPPKDPNRLGFSDRLNSAVGFQRLVALHQPSLPKWILYGHDVLCTASFRTLAPSPTSLKYRRPPRAIWPASAIAFRISGLLASVRQSLSCTGSASLHPRQPFQCRMIIFLLSQPSSRLALHFFTGVLCQSVRLVVSH